MGKHRVPLRERVKMADPKGPFTSQEKWWCNDCNKSFPSSKVERHMRSLGHKRKIEKLRKGK